MVIMKAENLKKVYGNGENEVRALDGVNLEVEKGEFVMIVGTSGSGKSTLLHMLGGLDVPTSGKVIIDGKDIFSLKDEQLTIFRRRILPVQLDGNMPDKDYMKQIIEVLGLEKKLNYLPNNLSGGQQQRVAIARALLSKPEVILADEPTGNLDSRTSQDVIGLLKVTSERFSQTIVMITHNEEIAQMGNRIIRIEDGKIV